MVRAGEKYEHRGVTFEITKVKPIFSFGDTEVLEITYRIIDGKFKSPQGKIFMRSDEDIRNHVRDVVDSYLDIKEAMKG